MQRKLFAFLFLLFTLFSVVTVTASADSVDAETSPVTYDGLQLRLRKDMPGIRSLYTVDMEKVAALENAGYTVEFGAIIATETREGAFRTPRDLAVTKGDNGYTPTLDGAAAVTVYSSDATAGYATNLFVSRNGSTATFAYTGYFRPDDQTRTYFEASYIFAAFCTLTKNGVTEIVYTYGEGNEFGTADSTYGVGCSLYELSAYWNDDANPDSSDAIRNNQNVRKVIGIYMKDTEAITFDTPLSLSKGQTTDTYTLTNMREGIYKVTVGYTAGTKYYHKLSYNDRAAVQYINAATDATADVFYVHLEEGDNTVSFTAVTGAITLDSLTFTLAEELSTDTTLLSASLSEDRARITFTGTGQSVGSQDYNSHRFYRLRPGNNVAMRFYDMKAGYYNVYAIGSVSGSVKTTLRSIVGTAADGGETLTTVNSSLAERGNGSNGSGGAYLSLGTVQLYEGGNTLHLTVNSGVQVLFNEIILVPATHTVTFSDVDGKRLSVQKIYHGEDAVAPIYTAPENYKISEYNAPVTNVTADRSVTVGIVRETITASVADGSITPPSGVTTDENGYIPLASGNVATVTLEGATAGYYDLYLDFTASSQVKYLKIENSSITAKSLPRFRTRLEASESGTNAFACSVRLENGTNTLKISPEGNYGFALRGVRLVNVADASAAEVHIVANTYDTTNSVIKNTIDGTLNNHNVTIRSGDVILFPSVNISEDGAYRLYAVGNISKDVKLTLSTIAEGKNVSERVTLNTFTATANSTHGTSTSTLLLAINGDGDTFNLSAGTQSFALECSNYTHISTFFLVRVGDKMPEPPPEEPEYELPENAIDIYADYMPESIAPTKINEVLSSTYIAGGSGENNVYVHKLLVGVDELGLGIYTVVAHPAAEGEYPGVMFIHGGSGKGSDFYNGVVDAAKQGYIAISYDQPGIAAADCPSTGYNGPNYKFDFTGNPYTATMYKSVAGGLTVFNLLYTNAGIMDENGNALSGVSVMQDKIAINGISWGGNMTTMLAGLLGDYVDVAVAKYCTGSYLLSEYWYGRILGQVGSEEMLHEFCKYFDPASFADGITAKLFVIATTQDTYGSLPAIIKTYETAVNAECYDFVAVPNQNHGTTNLTNGANRTGMCTLLEWNYLSYALSGEGTAPVRVTVTDAVVNGDATDVTFTVSGEVTEMSLWYSDSTSKWTSSEWLEVTDVTDNGDGTYTVTAPITTGTYYVMVELSDGSQYSSMATIMK